MTGRELRPHGPETSAWLCRSGVVVHEPEGHGWMQRTTFSASPGAVTVTRLEILVNALGTHTQIALGLD
jgi:hypothetical protein